MGSKILKVIRGSWGLITLASLGLLIGVHLKIQGVTQNAQNFSVLFDGLTTCMTRLGQSYTARIINQSSGPYLQNKFFALTEECFGETIETLDAINMVALNSTKKKLNNLSSNVHWFHEKLETPEKGTTYGENVGKRYEEIENIGQTVFQELNYQKRENLSQSYQLNLYLYGLSGILGLLILGSLLRQGRHNRGLRDIEKLAKKQLQGERPFSGAQVESILNRGLTQNELFQTTQLFMQYHADLLEGKQPRAVSVSEDTKKYVPPKAKPTIIAKKPNFGSLVDVTKKKALPNHGVSVDKILARVVDVLSSKVFTQGIVLDLDIDENVRVEAKEEALEQVFYHVIVNAINACSESEEPKKITVRMKKLGGTIMFEVQDSGKGFQKEFLRYHKGLEKDAEESFKRELGIGLTITTEFMKEFGGKITFENLNEEEKVVGGKVKLVFKGLKKEKAAPLEKENTKSNKLISVHKGKKKDLIEKLAREI